MEFKGVKLTLVNIQEVGFVCKCTVLNIYAHGYFNVKFTSHIMPLTLCPKKL